MLISIAINSFSSQAYASGKLQRIRKEPLTEDEVYGVTSGIPADQPRVCYPETVQRHTAPTNEGTVQQ